MNQRYLPFLLIFFMACHGPDEVVINDANNPPPTAIGFTVVKVYPHDTASYTQGLEWHSNGLLEGTGMEGQSRMLIADINNGKSLKQVMINPKEFGEGVTLFNHKIYQLTWKDQLVHVYDENTLEKIKDFPWPYQGWGITNNGKQLIISTGSSNLYFVNADSFKITNIVGVSDNYGPTGDLNELEYINGFIYANQYMTDYILKINPETGRVLGKIDCSGLLEKSGKSFDPQMYEKNTGNVLNGIAYDSAKNSLYITGKRWPALFEIKLNE